MKQLPKLLGKGAKIQINEKDGDPYTPNKNSDSDSIQNHPQDGDLDSNKLEHESSRISKGKYNLNEISRQINNKSSCFTKVNEMKTNNNYKSYDKENIDSNNDLNDSQSGSENLEHSDNENISQTKTSYEEKVAKFLNRFSKKFNSFTTDRQYSQDEREESK